MPVDANFHFTGRFPPSIHIRIGLIQALTSLFRAWPSCREVEKPSLRRILRTGLVRDAKAAYRTRNSDEANNCGVILRKSQEGFA